MNIRITKRPGGEAPENVRDAWIGLSLPVVPRYSGRLTARGFGVRSAPKIKIVRQIKSFLGLAPHVRGYVVDAATAVELLERTNPTAAAWWRTNVPHLIKKGRPFLFDENCCMVDPAKPES